MKRHWIYIICSKKNGTLYTGVTSDISRRIYEHQQFLIPGFAQKHKVKILVYMEEHATMYQAIQREKQIKHWNRSWKVELIEQSNPAWHDLSYHLVEGTL